MATLSAKQEEMVKYGKKNFFPHDRKISEATQRGELLRAEKDLVQRISELSEDRCLVIAPFDPKERTARQAWKYSDEVSIGRRRIGQVGNELPYDFIKEAFEELEPGYFVGIGFNSFERGFAGVRTRIPLTSLVDGDKLFTYAELSPSTQIDVKAYADRGDTRRKGGKFHVTVPSRTPSNGRYDVTLEGVPVSDCRRNRVVWTNMTSVHSCPLKNYDLNYRYKRKNEFDEHEVAAYLAVAQHQAEQGDVSALRYSPIMRPTQQTADFNKKIEEQVVVEYRDDRGKLKKRYATTTEREMLLVNYVQQNGLEETFRPLVARQELVDYLH